LDKAENTKIIDESLRSKNITKSRKGKFSKYSDLFVGKRGILALLKYEIITGWFGSFPGAAGILLRNIFYRFLFAKVGKNVNFAKNITIRHPNKISIGDDVIIDENCMLDAKGIDNKGIVIKNGVYLGRNSILSCKNGDITLEENVNIGFNCEVFSASDVVIGENTLIAAYVYVIAGDHDYNMTEKPISEQEGLSKGIQIEKNCWLGAKSMVLDGTKMGSDSILGANAVLSSDIAPFSVAVGTPAKVIKKREQK
jgi:acetyltransferase-like isoleucine patch superfamily enzyme